jgi:hypothetical protein
VTPNPTARPFVVGALLFLALVGLWPGRARADRAAKAGRAPVAARTLYR